MVHRHNLYDYFGVSGPGDGFMSVGPGGMTSQQHQDAIAAHDAEEADSSGFFGGLFGDDEVMTAEGGAVDAAAEQVIDSVEHNQAAAASSAPSGGSPTPLGGASAAPGAPIPPTGLPSKGNTNLVVLGVIGGIAAFFLFGK